MTSITERSLRDRMAKAETAEEVAEICLLEAQANGGPFWCQVCGAPYHAPLTSRRLHLNEVADWAGKPRLFADYGMHCDQVAVA